ncbi:MAG: deoxyribose-phosphate aldolase, partial [Calditrichaeota bacterium]
MEKKIATIQKEVQKELKSQGLPFLSDQPLFWRPLIQKEENFAHEIRKKDIESIPPLNLAPFIDHTLLKPEATHEQIFTICQEAIEHHFAAVCVNPYWVKVVAQELKKTEVNVCSVVGFPLGATSTTAKVAEAEKAISDGADEIDMVLNVGELKEKHWD